MHRFQLWEFMVFLLCLHNDRHTPLEKFKLHLSQYFDHELSFCLYFLEADVSGYQKTVLAHANAQVLFWTIMSHLGMHLLRQAQMSHFLHNVMAVRFMFLLCWNLFWSVCKYQDDKVCHWFFVWPLFWTGFIFCLMWL